MVKENKELKTKKKTTPKKTSLKKKAKPVIIDVIEDEPLVKEVEETISFPEFFKENKEKLVLKEEPKEKSEEIDQQKKFFSELVTEMKQKNPKGENHRGSKARPNDLSEPELPTKKSLNLYRRLVWKFIGLVLFLAALVAYFSFSTLNISITPNGETLNDSLFLRVNRDNNSANIDPSDPREIISGQVKEVETSVEKNYPASGEEFTGEEIVGRVKIINNYTKSQALVATTRLLSPDNKLFRIKNAVNVPAGGEVEVDIYTDKPSQDLAVGPTTFVIPGLWLGLQDKIFARSSEEFIYQQKIKKYIKPSDLEQATRDINDLLIKTAKEDKELSSEKENWLYDTSSQATIEINAKAGEVKDEFTVKAKGKIIAVSFSPEQTAKLATTKLNLLVPDDKELIEFKPENIVYSFENYDSVAGVATIKATFTGTMALKSDSEIVDRDRLVNLTKDQIDNYLKDFPEIKKYELRFSPAFVKKAPSLVDRIKIKINKE